MAEERFDAVVVGAGFAGLYALHKLRSSGLKVRVYEAGSGIGGTWFWNRYPGCRCDVESLDYSYSFSAELEQEWEWTERYPSQGELLRYLEHVADRFDLMRDIQLETRVTAARYDEATRGWEIETDRGERVSAQFCIMATGCLSAPNFPDIPGLESFAGDRYHTARWPEGGVDFTGRRVAVIGTGSTGVQAIPVIAEQAEHLVVFQRTANFVVPARNKPLDPELQREVKATYPERRETCRTSAQGVFAPVPQHSAMAVDDAEREATYAAGWAAGGGIGILGVYTDTVIDERSNATAADFVRARIREVVEDPETAEKLIPDGHPIGTKRICVGTDYFETFNRDNVTLVDVRATPITEITPTAVRTTDGEYPVDALVCATGFDAMTGAVRNIDVRGRDGASLAEYWHAGPRAYLGLAAAGFPNLFLITGPGSPSVLSNMVVSIEQHVDWIAQCLADLEAGGFDTIEADREAEAQWVAHVQEVAGMTLFLKAASWYVGANIPGKPRIFMPYVGGVGNYRNVCDDVARDGYRGFVRARAREPLSVA